MGKMQHDDNDEDDDNNREEKKNEINTWKSYLKLKHKF